jgi:ribosomal protein L40E
MKHCSKCYEDNPPDAIHCGQCGSPLDQKTRTCPAGHPMDPSWKECAYCKSQEAAAQSASSSGAVAGGGRRATVVEGVASGRRMTEPDSNGPDFDGQLNFDDPGSSEKRGKTVFRQPESSPSGKDRAYPAPGARKIVGVLITYTWRDDGQIFPIREGRNLIGRDPEKCDIAISEDDTLSAVNSHITFRKDFVIGDNVSMSGTYVDNEPIEEQFRPLKNYARIRTGSTVWTFIAIDPTHSSEKSAN